MPGEDGASALRELQELVDAARRHAPRLDASVRVTLERNPSEVGVDSDIAASVLASAADALGAQPGVMGATYWMDMALLNEAGIPTVAFGPSGHGEHADVEWVDAASLERCVETYLHAAARLCGPAKNAPAAGSQLS